MNRLSDDRAMSLALPESHASGYRSGRFIDAVSKTFHHKDLFESSGSGQRSLTPSHRWQKNMSVYSPANRHPSDHPSVSAEARKPRSQPPMLWRA
jgi:hypothetical protein